MKASPCFSLVRAFIIEFKILPTKQATFALTIAKFTTSQYIFGAENIFQVLAVAPKFNRANVQATTRARVPVERRGCAKTRAIRSQVLLGCALDTARRVMQLTARQRCAAVGFIKQLYLDRLWSYGLKVRAINSQSSARAAEGDAGASGTPAEKYLFSLDLYIYMYISLPLCLRLSRQYRMIILIRQFHLSHLRGYIYAECRQNYRLLSFSSVIFESL